MTIKVSVKLSPVDVAALEELAAKRGTTVSEVVRQAIGTEVFVERVDEEGGRVLVEDRDGRVRQLIPRKTAARDVP